MHEHLSGRRVREVQRRCRLGYAIFNLIKEMRRKSSSDENRDVEYSLVNPSLNSAVAPVGRMPSYDKRKGLEDALPPMYESGACDVCSGDPCMQLLKDANGIAPGR